MKVKVKGLPVRYNDKRYAPGETLDINQDSYNESLFEKVAAGKKKEDQNKADEE
jgi:hypothetical protein